MRTYLIRRLRYYMVLGRDRFNAPTAEVGRAERIVECDDGTRVPIVDGTCPALRLIWGNWSVGLQVDRYENHIELAVGRVWVEIDLPRQHYTRLRQLRRG